jgi:hypothetical protein
MEDAGCDGQVCRRRRRRRGRRPIVQKYWNILKTLCLLDDTQRVALLRKADAKLVTYICECALNILRGNIPFTNSRYKRQLRPHAPLLRKLATPAGRGGLSVKKRLVVKSARILPLIVKPILLAWNLQEK